MQARSILSCLLALGLLFALSGESARAHSQSFAIEGKKVQLKASKNPKKNKFKFQAKDQEPIGVGGHDPAVDGFQVLVVGTGPEGGRSELIDLSDDLVKGFWKPIGKPGNIKGYKYKDKSGLAGGITKVTFKPEQIKIDAKGENWSYVPGGELDSVEVYFQIEQEWFCAEFGGDVKKNDGTQFKAQRSAAPLACGEQVCGNGILEAPEECDDGDLNDTDGCNADCTLGECVGEDFASTYEAIQYSIFGDGTQDNLALGCTTGPCHQGGDLAQADLDLTPLVSYEALMGPGGNGADTDGAPGLWKRIVPGEPELSALYEKLLAKVENRSAAYGSPMPVGGGVASPEAMRMLELWIQGGAPETGVVEGTTGLAGCLPEPTPLKIPPPDVPDPAAGVQLQQPAWALPMQSENEVCTTSYFDFTARVPPAQQYDCLLEWGPNNTTGKCFRFHKQLLAQDAQSHHSIIDLYHGDYSWNRGPLGDPSEADHEDWGPWTIKTNDPLDPTNGDACDPTAIQDPTLGFVPNCSSEAIESIACLSYGPPDFQNGGVAGGSGPQSTTRSFSGSQQSYYEVEFADGVYVEAPLQGLIVWNSHAFNLTNFDTTMAQYLNLDLAGPTDQSFPVRQIFQSDRIFAMSDRNQDDSGSDFQGVPAFETAEYCYSWTAPQYAKVFQLSSHMHRHGVQWRTWGPTQDKLDQGWAGLEACTAAGGGPTSIFEADGSCTPPAEQPIYISTEYNDPETLVFEPPVALDDADPTQRTYRFCALFDNGSTPISPSVTRASQSPPPPPGLGFVDLGGPCLESLRSCLDGPNKGVLCNGDHSFCDSSPGAADGLCDACPVRGGVTTEGEMMILLGNYYVDAP